MKDCSKAFSLPKQSQDLVQTNGCKAMVALFNADQKDSLASIRYNMLCKKVARATMFITPERLPPTASACKFHSLRTDYQVMEWMGCSDEMTPSEWGWKVERDKRVPVMTDKPCSRCTDSDNSLQLFRRMQYPKVYLQKAWTRVYQCMWTLPRWQQ